MYLILIFDMFLLILDYLMYRTWCGAHKIELVSKKAFKQSVPQWDSFEYDVNSFATFYNNQNHKKLASLHEFESQAGDNKHLKLYRLFPIRYLYVLNHFKSRSNF